MDDGQQLPLGHLLAQLGVDGGHDTRYARHHVRGAVFVKADLAGQQHLLFDRCRARLGQHHASLFGLRRTELDQALSLFFALGMLPACGVGVPVLAASLGLFVVVLPIGMLVRLLVRTLLGSGFAMVLAILVGLGIGMARCRCSRCGRRARAPQQIGATGYTGDSKHPSRNPLFGRRERRIECGFLGHGFRFL